MGRGGEKSRLSLAWRYIAKFGDQISCRKYVNMAIIPVFRQVLIPHANEWESLFATATIELV